uniref:DNA helicase Pif1-like 2B domain-containing protein n=1 Tax=Octopus bimaculoides TaxID=37653 RepID=A0A0L8ICI7_OCTBM
MGFNPLSYNGYVDPKVWAAREHLKAAKEQFLADPTEERKENMEVMKEELCAAYTEAREEALIKKIRRMERAVDGSRGKESWSIINEITGKKRGSSSHVQGTGPEDRKSKWLDHFKTLLGEPPSTNQNTGEIRQLFEELNIETGPFVKEELQRAKKKIKEDKAYGDDGVAPEVMKRSDFDDIVLEFCNQRPSAKEGKVPRNDRGDISISELCNTVDNPSNLLETVFPNLKSNNADINWLSERTILAPKNVAVSAINDQLISRIPGEEVIYKSIDRTSDPQDIVNYPIEVLNSLEPAGLPPHIHRLRIGCPIMLIRILLPPKQCNGTRLVIKSLTPHLIKATIVTGCGKGENVFISRMQLYPSGSDMPFNFRRSQFPVRPCFAMSINKSQGQTLSVAGIHLGFSIQSG